MRSQKNQRKLPVVQWLGLHAFTAQSMGKIPAWGAKIPQAMQQCGQNFKNKKQKKTDHRFANFSIA